MKKIENSGRCAENSRNFGPRFFFFLFFAALAILIAPRSFAATASDVALLVKSGLQENVVIAKVEAEGLSGPVTVDDLVVLKKAGVSADGIKRLLALEKLSAPSPTGAPAATMQHAAAPVQATPGQLQPVYLPPQTAYTQPQPGYTQPQPAYSQPQTAYAQPQLVFAQPQTSHTHGTLTYGPIIGESYRSPHTTLVISNRNAHSISVAVDSDAGVIYCTRAFHGDPRSIRPMRTAAFTVPAGDYIVVVDGYEKIMSFHMTPGTADLLIMNPRGRSGGYEFVLSQNGRRIHAVERLPVDCYKRKVFVSIPLGHGKIVIVQEKKIDPVTIFLGRGWKWPGHRRHDPKGPAGKRGKDRDGRGRGRDKDWKH